MFCSQAVFRKLIHTSYRVRNRYVFVVLLILMIQSLRVLYTKTDLSPETSQLFTNHKTDPVKSPSTPLVLKRSMMRKRGDTSKVIILTYERSGSTLMGEMFNQNNEAFYWFEPLHDSLFWLWNNGSLRSQEKNVKILKDILDCRLQRLPIEINIDMFILEQSVSQRNYKTCILRRERFYPLLYHCRLFLTSAWPKRLKIVNVEDWDKSRTLHSIWKVFKNYRDSLKTSANFSPRDELVVNILKSQKTTGVLDLDENRTYQLLYRLRDFCSDSAKPRMTHCIRHLENACKKAPVRSIKTIRFQMKYAELLLRSERDLKIIHLVRDPRAVLQSRFQVQKDVVMKDGHPINIDLNAASNQLCTSILRDVEAGKNFRTFIDSPIIQINYEYMIKEPERVLRDVYKFLNIALNANIRNWLWNTMHARKDNGALGTARKNPLGHINKWMETFSAKAVKEIDDSCEKLYTALGYKRFSVP